MHVTLAFMHATLASIPCITHTEKKVVNQLLVTVTNTGDNGVYKEETFDWAHSFRDSRLWLAGSVALDTPLVT